METKTKTKLAEPEKEVYTKAVIYNRELWYIGKGRQRTKVTHEDRPKILRQMKADQVGIYSEVCQENSTILLPNREYTIGYGEIELREEDLALLD
jgi:hypothetical protein